MGGEGEAQEGQEAANMSQEYNLLTDEHVGFSTKGDCMALWCKKCGDDVQVEYLGRDPLAPRFRLTCEPCKKQMEYKVSPTEWTKFPHTPLIA